MVVLLHRYGMAHSTHSMLVSLASYPAPVAQYGHFGATWIGYKPHADQLFEIHLIHMKCSAFTDPDLLANFSLMGYRVF
jgi:hypothetical protein